MCAAVAPHTLRMCTGRWVVGVKLRLAPSLLDLVSRVEGPRFMVPLRLGDGEQGGASNFLAVGGPCRAPSARHAAPRPHLHGGYAPTVVPIERPALPRAGITGGNAPAACLLACLLLACLLAGGAFLKTRPPRGGHWKTQETWLRTPQGITSRAPAAQVRHAAMSTAAASADLSRSERQH